MLLGGDAPGSMSKSLWMKDVKGRSLSELWTDLEGMLHFCVFLSMNDEFGSSQTAEDDSILYLPRVVT